MHKLIISDYLVDFDRPSGKGTCKSCFRKVSWSQNRVAAHKRANCTDPVHRKKFQKIKSSKGLNLVIPKYCSIIVKFSDENNNIVISEYLENFDKLNGKGKCKSCSKYVTWSRERLAAHKRASCTDPSIQHTKSSKDYRFSISRSHLLNNKILGETNVFDISKYLSNFDKTKRKGTCRACSKPVCWSRNRIGAHKRASCTNVTIEEKKLFLKKRFKSSDYDDTSLEESDVKMNLNSLFLHQKPAESSLTNSNCHREMSTSISENSCYVCKNVLLALRSPLDILLKFTKTPLYQYLGERKIFQHINKLL